MIRTNLEDFTDEEYENVLIPYEDNFKMYIEKYILPEIIAFAIASGFERNAIWTGSLKVHYNSIKDRIPIYGEDYDSVIKDIKNILEIKYSLVVTNDDPLEIKKIQYNLLIIKTIKRLYYSSNTNNKNNITSFYI